MTLPTPYYQDEFVTLYHGDSRELLPHIHADVMVTDPPYGLRDAGGAFDGIRGDGDTTVRDHVVGAWCLERQALVFGAPHLQPPPATVSALCWHKINGAPGLFGAYGGWRRDFELIYLCGPWRRVMRESQTGVLQAPSPSETQHRHEKPISIMRQLVSRVGGIVVDPFAGTGTTLRATKDIGRQAIGIEIDETWCSVAAQRMAQEVMAL